MRKLAFLKSNIRIKLPLLILVAVALVLLWIFNQQKNYSPKILVIGDSQISFGAGKVYLEFFDEFKKDLPQLTNNQNILNLFNDAETAAIGVRSTSLLNWTTREEGKIKDVICEVDKRWGVNAGVYGIQNKKNRKYVNIGQGDAYQFCQPNQSAFEAMFENGYYQPELLILAFMGNSDDRWAESLQKARDDVTAMMQQIPQSIPCIFLTTSPSFDEATNQIRWKAQTNIKQAFEDVGSTCEFVSGFTKETVEAAQGNKSFFRTNDEGKVIDIHHPNLKAARKFFELIKNDLNKSIIRQMDARLN